MVHHSWSTSSDAYAGRARRAAAPLFPHSWGAGGARIALHTEFYPSLPSYKTAFSSIVDSLIHKDSSVGNPPDP